MLFGMLGALLLVLTLLAWNVGNPDVPVLGFLHANRFVMVFVAWYLLMFAIVGDFLISLILAAMLTVMTLGALSGIAKNLLAPVVVK